jgi:hypothetical protein
MSYLGEEINEILESLKRDNEELREQLAGGDPQIRELNFLIEENNALRNQLKVKLYRTSKFSIKIRDKISYVIASPIYLVKFLGSTAKKIARKQNLVFKKVLFYTELDTDTVILILMWLIMLSVGFIIGVQPTTYSIDGPEYNISGNCNNSSIPALEYPARGGN